MEKHRYNRKDSYFSVQVLLKTSDVVGATPVFWVGESEDNHGCTYKSSSLAG